MRTLKFEAHDEWMGARMGKITGSRLNSIVVKRGNGKKIGFYELIAERLGVPADGENPMERGSRLEKEAVERFEKETGKKVDGSLLIWARDDDESIAISQDGVVLETKKPNTEAVEVKCLSSARHIEAYLTKKVPDEYEFQVLQYFIVNDELKKLHFVCYDPRFAMFAKPHLDFFVIEVSRKDVEDQVKEYLEYQRKTLAEVYEIVNQLTF